MENFVEDRVARLREAESFNHAFDMLFKIAYDLGYSQIHYAYLPVPARLPNGEWLPLKLNARNAPPGFEKGWEQFMTADPYYHACFGGTLPIDWADVNNNDLLSPVQRAACHYLADFGLEQGMTIPVHLPFGRFAVVSAVVDRSCRNWVELRDNTRETMFQLTHIFHKTIHDKQFENQIQVASPTRLSPREMECLEWAAAGKTSPEIAQIIGRSVETVRLHIKNAIFKLNASDRAHVVAKAVQLGLLQPN